MEFSSVYKPESYLPWPTTLRFGNEVLTGDSQSAKTSNTGPSRINEIERFIVDEIKAIGRDPALVAATVAESRRLVQAGIKRLKAERATLERQSRADGAELCKFGLMAPKNGELARMAEVEERNLAAERRIREIGDEIAQLVATDVSEDQVADALGEFNTVWAALAPKEQARVLALLIEQIDHDGESGNVAITFRPSGLKSLTVAKPDLEETAA